MRDGVAPRVRWANLDQLNQAATHLDIQTTFERTGGHAHFDAVELEGAEERPEQSADLAGCRVQRSQHGRRHLCHLVRGGHRADDLGLIQQLVAIAVVAVGVGVDQCDDGRGASVVGHRLQHPRRQRQVEQRVDQQRRAIADDQTGVAPAPTTVGLQVCMAPIGNLVQTPFVRRCGHLAHPLSLLVRNALPH